jgi:CheY-like chemotaxis protein
MILLVEDDPADSRLIQRALGKVGIAEPVMRLTNGEDAIAYLRGDHPYGNRQSYPFPDLILLDIKLPNRNGFEVLEWIRSQKTILRRSIVVMMTSSRHAVDVSRAYELGVNSYLVKPETTEALVSMTHLIKQYWLDCNENPATGVVRGV